MKHMQKTFFEATFMCAPSFLVCAHLTTCVHAQDVHSLEGTLTTRRLQSIDIIKHISDRVSSVPTHWH